MTSEPEKFLSYRSTGAVVNETPRVLWAVSKDRPQMSTAFRVAQRVNRRGRQPHAVWHPETGEIVHMIPPGKKNGMYNPRLPASDLYTVLAVASQRDPFTDFPEEFRTPILELLTAFEIPGVWPAGPPTGGHHRTKLAEPGHYSTCQVDTTYGPVGRIDTARLKT